MDSSSNTSSETLTLSSVSYSMERTEEESSTSYSDPTPYDVFLSFNGKNSRYKFTSHLYDKLDSHGIRTYMDDPELRVGEVISEALIQAIKDSKIYVAVFTENYADSSWCLDELVEMYKCYQTHQRLIIGVYCNIDPSVVRHQTDSFKEAFKKHETDREGRPKVQADKTNQWRTTLGNVAAFSGKHIYSQRSEADVVNEILERILLEINPKALHVTRHPVGINTRVKEITTLLSKKTEGVLMFGIYGMRGVGKTTLAKAVYNQLLPNFKASCCFLADVRTKGLASLQQKLINDVLKSKKTLEVHSVDEGIMLIDARICKTKVLVLIDDVDKKEQVHYLVRKFESGSVVILTTTDEAMLGGINVEPQFRYRLQRLDDVEARSLFTKYAFENGKVNNTLMQCFYKRIQELADGLPLALAVFGSYLCDQHDDEGWRSYINKLEQNPDTDINGRLLITLNAIEKEDPMLKTLFLDIACFFIGKPEEFTLGILETYYVCVAHKIDILKKRSLLTINSWNGVLGMHGLLQDMGRDAVRNNFPHDQPQKHSRLWAPKDICNVLEEGKGTDVIEGIIPYDKDANEEITFSTTETFKKMINLRFLHLKNVNLDGSFQQKFGSLRWLRWDCCLLMELPSGFRAGRLVVLELPDSKIKKWELNKEFEYLKTLDMSKSINLTTVPDLAKLPNLETLNLEGCKSLEKVDIPDNSLMKLVSFQLSGCVKLTNIHVIGSSSLRVLEVLDVSRCEILETLPHQLWEITSLRKIYLGTSHDYLEAPFKHLILSCKNFTALPSFYSHLKLEHLNLFQWPKLLSIEQLPPNLKKLRLNGCSRLVRLPNLLSLTQLEHLDMESCSSLTEIQGLEECTSLRHLDLNGCNSSLHAKILTTPFFQVLEKLKTLDMSLSPYLTEISDFTMLPSLESLKFKGCPRLEKVLISAKSLTELVSFDLSGCRKLEEIHISNESLLKLVSLNLDDCCKLSSIEQLPPNLKELHLDSCESLESLPNLSSLTQLNFLDITCCRGLTEIKGLEELTSIYDLGLDYCKSTLHTNILTESFFQIYSGLKHMVTISAGQFPNWFKSDLCTEYGYTYMIPKCGLDILAVIIFLEEPAHYIEYYECDVKNVTSGKSYRYIESMIFASKFMIILPRSIFSAKEGDELYVRSYGYIRGIHLVYDE